MVKRQYCSFSRALITALFQPQPFCGEAKAYTKTLKL